MALKFKKKNIQEQHPESNTFDDTTAWDSPTAEEFDNGSNDSGSDPVDLSVTALCGANSQTFQLAGQTVGDARQLLGHILNIEPGAAALVNGEEVKAKHVLKRSDHLEFVKKAGEKGLGE